MSRSLQIARRYAKALLDVAEQEKGVDAVRADLAEVRRWIAEVPAFHVFAACDHLGGRELRLRALLELDIEFRPEGARAQDRRRRDEARRFRARWGVSMPW